MRSLLPALLLCLVLTTPVCAAEVRLSVAASMTDAVNELIASYRIKAAGASFLPNFGSSGALAKQIAQGAPADIFISANPKWMSYLVEQGSIAPGQVRNLAFNSLVFVGRKGLAVASLEDLARLGRIAIGSPRSVPAGQYAEQALKAAGLYDRLGDRLVMAQDVRQALVYADRGETDGAFVYRTDALLAKEAVILLEVPQGLYDEVTYPVGLTQAGAKNPEAVAFLEYLAADEAAKILTKYGFVVR
ncbi:molybdate ABC transporter substrate-binding protein [Desulfuromonas versatilis]|uniref:Molybdate ABC transporter substrate-binding protein n=1 Tax=Desulfuromonas versatilis TaxID=2802975 RepID=A0ABM8I217_9BACT|nr:molybdate ABC transporter substrate-binding protein [Desulfuromonas versatilis]BCR07014.1 molybdate ABC transporter substrate-binding protein [Desulfuromonas versatilis]